MALAFKNLLHQYDEVSGTWVPVTTDDFGPQNSYEATSAPSVTNDSSEGFGVGSQWVDTTADEAYICVDASVGAAVWENITLTADDLADVAVSGSYDDLTDAPFHDSASNWEANGSLELDIYTIYFGASNDSQIYDNGSELYIGSNNEITLSSSSGIYCDYSLYLSFYTLEMDGGSLYVNGGYGQLSANNDLTLSAGNDILMSGRTSLQNDFFCNSYGIYLGNSGSTDNYIYQAGSNFYMGSTSGSMYFSANNDLYLNVAGSIYASDGQAGENYNGACSSIEVVDGIVVSVTP